jgi:hypothetical protein
VIAQVYVGDTAPTGIQNNSLWWNSTDGCLYVYYYDGDSHQWVIAAPVPSLDGYLQLAGGTMTGALVLAADPVANLQAATKQYVDSKSAFPEAPTDGSVYGRQGSTTSWQKAVPLAGGTMTGLLTLSGDPTATNGAATKHYVDANAITDAPADGYSYGRNTHAWTQVVPLSGGTMTGLLTLSADPTAALGAATKQYADTKAPLASPAFTGTPTAPTPTAGDATTKIATTNFVASSFAPLASPTFTGDPKAPTPAPGDNDTSIATTAFVNTFVGGSGFAPIASPTFTGDPKAPTATVDDNDTSIATTAFIQGQGATANPLMNGTAAPGTSLRWAHGDHVHPTDTSRAPTASPTFTGAVNISGTILYTGVGSPASLSGNQNNWSPTGLGSSTVFRISSSAAVNITGLVAQPAGTSLVLINIGTTYPITLTNLDSNSSALNQFNLGANVVLGPSQSVQLWYDGTTGVWRPKAGSGSGGGGGASVTISDTAPVAPTAGNLWWNSATGHLYIYYYDGTSSQWVIAEPLPDLSQYVQIFAQDSRPTSANPNALWLNTATGALYFYYNDGNSIQWIYISGGAPATPTAYVLGGRFKWLSGTSCQLIPYRGDAIRIAGVIYSIPSAGITITTSGLSASTTYYAYAYMSAGVMNLEFSTTGHVTDTTPGNVGTEIKSGDPSRTLVGIASVSATSTFGPSDGQQYRLVRSWMNRAGSGMQGTTIGSNIALGASPSQIAPAVFFASWANETVTMTVNFTWFSSTASGAITAYINFDGSTLGPSIAINPDASGRVTPSPFTVVTTASEGSHTVFAQATTSGGGSAYSSSNMNATLTE